MSDLRDIAADVLQHAAGFGESRARRTTGAEALGFQVGAAIASAVAELIRALGADDAKKQIEDLVARKNEGAISDDDLRDDDARVRDEVADMFRDDDANDDSE